MEVGWGVVGTGRQARGSMIPAIGQAHGAKLVGFCSSEPGKAEDLTPQYPGTKIYRNIDELIADDAVDVVYVATPNFLHVPHAVQAITAVKHVFIEAPLALSVDGANKLVEKAKRNEVKLGVGMHLRHHPLHRKMKERLDRMEVGTPVFIEAQYFLDIDWPDNWWRDDLRAGPASLMALGIHAIDLVTWLKGDKVKEVMALGRGSADRPAERGINTMLTVIMSFSDGAQGLITCSSESAFAANNLSVTGNQGRIQAECALGRDPFSGNLAWCYADGKKQEDFEMTNPYQAQVEGFSKAVSQNTEFRPDGHDGQALVEITCAIIESMKSRRVVKVGEIQRLTGGI